MHLFWALVAAALAPAATHALIPSPPQPFSSPPSIRVLNFTGTPNDDSLAVCRSNAALLQSQLQALLPGDTLLVAGQAPGDVFHIMGGVEVYNISQVTWQIDATIKLWAPTTFLDDIKEWPFESDGRVKECLYFEEVHHFTITSSNRGIIDGNGKHWWGAIKYLIRSENRPRLLHMEESTFIIVENIRLLQSPYWTTLFSGVSDIIVRHVQIEAKWFANATDHNFLELQAFNTDGIDIAGRNVHIHDCDIWNQDDCICVKGVDSASKYARCSENWLVERVNASGLGLTVGSIGPLVPPRCVRNITFQDSVMVNTFKGLYLKSRPSKAAVPGTGLIQDITYRNITIDHPEQWAIWLGPQQAIYGGACDLTWPTAGDCPVPAEMSWKNILFEDIRIVSPKMSPGVIIGNATNPMVNVTFANVVVTDGNHPPWNDLYYACHAVQGMSTRGTDPAPACFDGGCLGDGVCQSKAGVPCCSEQTHEDASCGRFPACG